VPVAPFFPGGHTENLLTVHAWHTDYFSHSNFYFLEKKCFFVIGILCVWEEKFTYTLLNVVHDDLSSLLGEIVISNSYHSE
jgi:hypothetical protein